MAQSKILALQPMAGEEMNLLQSNPHRDGFIDGERTLALQIMGLLEDTDRRVETEPLEEEMVMSLGRT